MTRASHTTRATAALSSISLLFTCPTQVPGPEKPFCHLHCFMEQQSRKPRASKSYATFLDKRKGSMVGFISNLAPLLNYLRRRSPGPPFSPDHRQAGERGAIICALEISININRDTAHLREWLASLAYMCTWGAGARAGVADLK